MMRRAQRAVAYAGADANEHRRNVRVTDVVLDLLQRTRREKAAGRNAKRFLATRRQSRRDAAYAEALAQLTRMGLTYPCFCTRKDIADEFARAGEAQHGPDGPIYPGTCRHLKDAPSGKPHVLRLDAQKAAALAAPLSFCEHGKNHAVLPLRFGDIVLARKDLPAAYHLAVVVDDAFQTVTLVTRGEDLRDATHVQRLLQALLQLPEPDYAHHRLILDDSGKKFSKRDNAVTLEALRQAGATLSDVYARLGL